MLGRIKTRISRKTSSGDGSSGSDHGRIISTSSSSGMMSTPPSNSKKSTMARPSSSGFRSRQQQPLAVDFYSKVEELATFDACVEACDALAAASSYAQSSGKRDERTGLRDCSVLVSPDGDLLLVPQDLQDGNGTTQSSSVNTTIDQTAEQVQQEAEEDANHQGGTRDATTESDEKSTVSKNARDDDAPAAASSEKENDIIITNSENQDYAAPKSTPSPFAHLADMTGDYEAAVVMGNDLCSDKSINGFSAVGWSPTATSLALRQTEQSLRHMATFVETIILSRKEAAARASDACDRLAASGGPRGQQVPSLPVPRASRSRSHATTKRRGKNSTTNRPQSYDDYDIITALDAMPMESGGSFELSRQRVGPLLFPGGTLSAAKVAMQQYHSIMAENDSNRLRMASKSVNSKVGVLPALHQAAEDAAKRAYNREKALKEMQHRADAMEHRLMQCKLEARRRWEAVHYAEEEVTRIVEARMLERSRERERRRLEQLRAQQDDRAGDLGATAGEIWDIVSAVAESMEDGSFAPTGLPDAPLSGPRDRSPQGDNSHVNDETVTESLEAVSAEQPRAPSPSFPLASRSEVEQECRLPELRAAAMVADEAIEDAAGSLLNILSTLDTTRRSARIAAETCLLSACHSQAACLRSLVAMERAAIEDRLENIRELERVVDGIDVRADLDLYINSDKKERGGSTQMGDDDDGGVASALAVLSSHVEGSMGVGSPSKLCTDGWEESEPEEVTPEQLEDAVEVLFEANALLRDDSKETDAAKRAREEFEETVDFLCKTATDKSLKARSRRSTICYSLNSKRSSNAEIASRIQFEGICRVFEAVLSGCDREPGGVALAKMCMMLSQTFYVNGEDAADAAPPSNPMGSPVRVARSKRVFVKDRLIDHPLWSDEEFWDQALYQCVAESLTHSGVMANFDRKTRSNNNQSEWTESKKLKWHDLTQKERAEAASQVHAVVFAQLGALAHSMVEFGLPLESSCAFVRRMSIRNQLPISQRTMLLKHLIEREGK